MIKISLLLILFILIYILPATAADHSINAQNVRVTPSYVEADGVCSCSLMQDLKHHHAAFINFCPACGTKGSLAFEEGPASYTCPEGMWYCMVCDVDYCIYHGKEHMKGTTLFLKTYKPPKIKYNPQPENKFEVIKKNYIQNKDRFQPFNKNQ